jgi:hypothetical protein
MFGGFIQSQSLHWLLAGFLGLAGITAWEGFDVRERLRSFGRKRDVETRILEIIFDENDPRCVRQREEGNGEVRRWWVGIRNASTMKSVDDVSLRAQQRTFVECTISVAHMLADGRLSRTPILTEVATLPPNAEEFVELFGLSASDTWVGKDILAERSTFVLEARGRDARTVIAVLEYDPRTRPPTIRRVS